MSPDGSKIVSPEEKLLRLIRGKGQASAPASQERHAAKQSPARRGTPTRVGWHLPSWWLNAITIGLGCLIAGQLVALVFLLTRPAVHVTADPLPPVHDQSSAASTSTDVPGEAPHEVPLPTPLASVVSRPMFQPASYQAAPGQRQFRTPSTQAKSLAGRLSLIGVVAGDPPQAIIEDAETKKTHFVTVGQPVIEGLIVEEVREDRVVLDLNGEKIELSL